jgi:hypothetical protein
MKGRRGSQMRKGKRRKSTSSDLTGAIEAPIYSAPHDIEDGQSKAGTAKSAVAFKSLSMNGNGKAAALRSKSPHASKRRYSSR